MSETMFAPGPCSLCGRDPAVGFASVGDDWYCHGDFDPEPTCYMRAQYTEPTDDEIYNRPGVEGGIGYPIGPEPMHEHDWRL